MEVTLDQALKNGIEAHKAGKVQEANRYYTTILIAQPKHSHANHNMGVLSVGVGKVQEALPFFKKALETNPSIDQFWLSYINALIKLNLLADAKAVLNEAKSKGVKGDAFGLTEKHLNGLEKGIEVYVAFNKSKEPAKEQLKNLVNLHTQGLFQEALAKSLDLLKYFPNSMNLYNIIGIANRDLGKLDEAVKAYNKALSLNPNYAEGFNNMGIVIQKQGKLEEAIKSYKKAFSIKPNYAEAYFNMGTALQNQGKLDKAIEAYNKAILHNPNYAQAYYNLGVSQQNQDKLDEAIEAYNKALLYNPNDAQANYNMGIAFKAQGKLDKAIASFNKAISLKPNFAKAYNNMGFALQEQGKLEAIEAYNKALSYNPNYAEAYYNIGFAFKAQGKLDKAIDSYKKAISLKPDYVDAHNNMGIILQESGATKKAIKAFKKSILYRSDFASAHHNLSFALLNYGSYQEGLDEYEWRWKTDKYLTAYRHFSQPLWNKKTSLNGKTILIWCEQGVGDTINWSSCISHIASKAKHCILECQEKLVPLLERSFPDIEVKAEDRNLDTERNDFDYHLPMGSLYKNLSLDIFKNTKVDAYLVPNPDRIKYWRKKLNSIGKGPTIGISWKSVLMSPERIPNYTSIFDWSPLFTIPNITFINLQPRDFESDLNKIKNKFGVKVYNFKELDHFENIDDVAALCSALDMVVSTKTTVPLISAGVGTLTKLANWRQSSWSNILLNPRGPFVDTFERDTWEPWENVFSLLKEDILKFTKGGCCK